MFFQYKMMERDTHSVFDGDKFNICFLELERFDNYLDKDSDLKEQWCWIFNNLTTFVRRPEHLDSSFDDIIEDAETRKLTPEEKLKYMESRQLTEYERTVIHEGGIIIGREEGFAEGKAEGIKEGKAEDARAMLADGMSPALVSKYTGLSEEEIAALR